MLAYKSSSTQQANNLHFYTIQHQASRIIIIYELGWLLVMEACIVITQCIAYQPTLWSIYMCVCVRACVHACMHACMHACIYIYIYCYANSLEIIEVSTTPDRFVENVESTCTSIKNSITVTTVSLLLNIYI